MMKLENLPKSKETKATKRVGRGPGSGMGKTSTRGQKGQLARSGSGISPWFQGGQTPLYRRIPKRGFNNARFEVKYATINLDVINKYFNDGETVSPSLKYLLITSKLIVAYLVSKRALLNPRFGILL